MRSDASRLILSCLFLCLAVQACSSKKMGTVKSPLVSVTNYYYRYQTPDGKSGTTNMVAIVVFDDGKEVQALPYANFTTEDGTHHSQLTKEGQRVEMEPPLGYSELWRMGRVYDAAK